MPPPARRLFHFAHCDKMWNPRVQNIIEMSGKWGDFFSVAPSNHLDICDKFNIFIKFIKNVKNVSKDAFFYN
jgi:hypothetical protein